MKGKDYSFWFLSIIVAIFMVAMVYIDEIYAYNDKRDFQKKLASEYTVTNIQLKHNKDIAFEGYKGMPCSNELKTNVGEVSFSHYNSNMPIFSTKSNNWKTVAYYVGNKLFIANYIMEYTSKELMKEYILKCDEELLLKQENKLKTISSNLNSWKQQNKGSN